MWKRPTVWLGEPTNYISVNFQQGHAYPDFSEVNFETPEMVRPTEPAEIPDGIVVRHFSFSTGGATEGTIYVDSFIGWLRTMRRLGCEITPCHY